MREHKYEELKPSLYRIVRRHEGKSDIGRRRGEKEGRKTRE